MFQSWQCKNPPFCIHVCAAQQGNTEHILLLITLDGYPADLSDCCLKLHTGFSQTTECRAGFCLNTE